MGRRRIRKTRSERAEIVFTWIGASIIIHALHRRRRRRSNRSDDAPPPLPPPSPPPCRCRRRCRRRRATTITTTTPHDRSHTAESGSREKAEPSRVSARFDGPARRFRRP